MRTWFTWVAIGKLLERVPVVETFQAPEALRPPYPQEPASASPGPSAT